MKEIQDSLFAMKRSALSRSKPDSVPFLLKHFNAHVFYNTSNISNVISRFTNAFVEALNECQRLAKYVLVIPDKDIVTRILHIQDGSSIMIGTALHSMMKNFDLFIERRKHNLQIIKPGALHADEVYPKIIWVHMLKRPKQYQSPAIALRRQIQYHS